MTVPGAAAGWCDTLDKFGTMSIDTVLTPAIRLAEDGFPVHPVAAHGWQSGAYLLKVRSYISTISGVIFAPYHFQQVNTFHGFHFSAAVLVFCIFCWYFLLAI